MIPAALPDPSQPSFVLFVAAFGAFLGATVGRVRGGTREEVRRVTENWAYAATAAALALYVLLLGLESM
jgi:hypothetical protein